MNMLLGGFLKIYDLAFLAILVYLLFFKKF